MITGYADKYDSQALSDECDVWRTISHLEILTESQSEYIIPLNDIYYQAQFVAI